MDKFDELLMDSIGKRLRNKYEHIFKKALADDEIVKNTLFLYFCKEILPQDLIYKKSKELFDKILSKYGDDNE